MKKFFLKIGGFLERLNVKSGKYIICFFIIASFFLWPFIFPYKTMTAHIEKDGVKYVIQRSNDSGNYYLKVDNIISNNYSYKGTQSSLFSTNSVKIETENSNFSTGKVITNEKISTGSFSTTQKVSFSKTNTSNEIKTSKGEYYFFQTKNKLIFTPELSYLDLEYLFDKPNYFDLLTNYITASNLIDLRFDCSSDYCKESINAFEERVGFLHGNDGRVHLKYQNIFDFKDSYLQRKPKIIQNVNIPNGFSLQVDGRNYDIKNKKSIDTETCLVDVYYGKNKKETKLLKETPFLEYISNSEREVGENQLVLRDRSYDPKIYISGDRLDNVKFVHPYNNYAIDLEMDKDLIEELEIDPFYEVVLIKYKSCEQTNCSRSFSLGF